ncbi:SDR family oxidoreductase [Nocardioides salsibiostraticola]
MNHLANRTIIVTGAASGFGRELTERAAARGANVGACDVDGEALAGLASDRVETGIVDVTDLPAMRAFAARVTERFGTIDVIINNAGVMPLAFYADHEAAAEAWSRCIDINLKGVLHGIIAVHDQMIRQGRGHVVNISSVFGNQPVAGAAVYGATKAAVNVLSESLRQESLGAIKVTTIRPTGVPGTGLAGGIINPEAINPVLGINKDQFYEKMTALYDADPPDALTSPDSIGYAALSPGLLADQVLHTIDQPWGVSISDITIRASNDDYLM